MLTTFPEITSKINRLNDIKTILEENKEDIKIIEEKTEIEEWLKNND